MSIEKVGVSIEAELNDKSFKKAGDEIVKYARDTKKQLDPILYNQLNLDVAKFQVKLDEAKRKLAEAKKEGNEQKIVFAQIDVNSLQRELTESKRLLNNFVNTGDKDLSRLQSKFNQTNDTIKDTRGGLSGLGNSLMLVSSAATALVATGFNEFIKSVGSSIFGTAGAFEDYQVTLTNALQSQEKATQAMSMLKEISAETPFTLDEITKSYIKLVNRGFIPTKNEITELGDLASSQGKSFDQLVEAMLDAQTGEFERLKEFGVKASSSGNKVSFTFRGVTTTVQKTDDAIKNYILSLGNLTGISGSMEARSQTLNGAISNFQDSITNLSSTFGSLFIPIITSVTRFLSDMTNGLTMLIEQYPTLSKVIGYAIGSLAILSGGIVSIGLVTTTLSTALAGLGLSFTSLGVTATLASGTISIAWLSILGPIGLVVAAGYGLYYAYEKNILGIQGLVSEFINGFRIFAEALSIVIGGIIESFIEMGSMIKNQLKKLSPLVYTTVNEINKAWSYLTNGQSVVGKVMNGIGTVFKSYLNSYVLMAQSAVNLINKVFGTNIKLPSISGIIDQAKQNIIKKDLQKISQSNPLAPIKQDRSLSSIDFSSIETIGNTGAQPGPSSNPVGKSGGGGKSAEQKLKDQIELKKKALEKEAELQIQSVKNSTKSEYEKAKEIIAIGEKLNTEKERLDDEANKSYKNYIDSQLDDAKDLVKEKQKLEEDAKKLAEKNFETLSKKGQDAFDKLTESIKKSGDEIKNLEEKIKGVNESISGVNNDIANRVITIEDELKKVNQDIIDNGYSSESQSKKIKLEKELAIAKDSITQDQLQKARDENAKSETEKLLDKRKALEQEQQLLQEKLDSEVQKQKDMLLEKLELEKAFTTDYKIELDKRGSAFEQLIDRQIAAFRKIDPNYQQNTQGTQTVTNNNKNISINAEIKNQVDAEYLFRKLSQ